MTGRAKSGSQVRICLLHKAKFDVCCLIMPRTTWRACHRDKNSFSKFDIANVMRCRVTECAKTTFHIHIMRSQRFREEEDVENKTTTKTLNTNKNRNDRRNKANKQTKTLMSTRNSQAKSLTSGFYFDPFYTLHKTCFENASSFAKFRK